jgi:hypothetical protein
MRYHSKKTCNDEAIEMMCEEDMNNIEEYLKELFKDMYQLENGEQNEQKQ